MPGSPINPGESYADWQARNRGDTEGQTAKNLGSDYTPEAGAAFANAQAGSRGAAGQAGYAQDPVAIYKAQSADRDMAYGGLRNLAAQQYGNAPTAEGLRHADDQGLNSESQALDRLNGLSQTGWDATSSAAYQQLQAQNEARASAQTAALQQQAQSRGMGMSGMAAMGAMQSEQEGATRNYAGGLQAAADAEQRRMQAIGASADLGSRMRGEGKADITDAYGMSGQALDRLINTQMGTSESAHKQNSSDIQQGWDMGKDVGSTALGAAKGGAR